MGKIDISYRGFGATIQAARPACYGLVLGAI